MPEPAAELVSTLLAAEHESPVDIVALVQRYLDTVAHADADSVGALFADNATLEDPVGCGVVHSGRQAITEFYRALDGAELTTQMNEIRFGGLEAVFSFVITMGSADARVTVHPMEVMVFNLDGEIVSMKAYWSRRDVTES